jgi:DNA-binding IclR family transcriptional regulator
MALLLGHCETWQPASKLENLPALFIAEGRTARRHLERLAPGTVTDPKELYSQLAQIRKRGWASSYEENNVGAWGLAAPILSDGGVVASIGFAAPTARYSESAVRSLAKTVLDAARESERSL